MQRKAVFINLHTENNKEKAISVKTKGNKKTLCSVAGTVRSSISSEEEAAPVGAFWGRFLTISKQTSIPYKTSQFHWK